ncbi:probable inactive serine/threonine-protein kinase slob2 [Carica papaya]|uniref:probable inactive serine/threonine-protein kinase slob2 n=1 Tax=Carica papaya TaxID=3649 RepID=UPI000B8C7DFB|nr:probable inactive serine/threonine-protein kinase slob2 [Carica papaya]
MARPNNPSNLLLLIMSTVLTLISFTVASNLTTSEKLDQTVIDPEIKCGACPCVDPCAQLPPPPPPPPSPPPPPPPPKTVYCNPVAPPPPRFIYVTGVPGQLYYTDADEWGFYSGAGRNGAMALMVLMGYGVFGLWENW